MKLIILEGCDNTGKSTVAEALRQDFAAHGVQASITHWGKPAAKTNKENYLWWMSHIALDLEGDQDVIIWDRSFIGNHIYGELYNDQATLSFNAMMELMNYIYNNHAFYIKLHLLQSDYETLSLRFVSQKEDYVPTEDITYLQMKYKTLFEYIKAVHEFMPWPKMSVTLQKENESIENIIKSILHS